MKIQPEQRPPLSCHPFVRLPPKLSTFTLPSNSHTARQRQNQLDVSGTSSTIQILAHTAAPPHGSVSLPQVFHAWPTRFPAHPLPAFCHSVHRLQYGWKTGSYRSTLITWSSVCCLFCVDCFVVAREPSRNVASVLRALVRLVGLDSGDISGQTKFPRIE